MCTEGSLCKVLIGAINEGELYKRPNGIQFCIIKNFHSSSNIYNFKKSLLYIYYLINFTLTSSMGVDLRGFT